jgi:hypothetical protein
VSDHACAHQQAEPATTPELWLKPGAPTYRGSSPVACGRLKPDTVRQLHNENANLKALLAHYTEPPEREREPEPDDTDS